MKKLFFLPFFIAIAFAASAQKVDLSAYTGKYKFPEGGPVSLLTITVKDSVLFASSDGGESELVPSTTADVFAVSSFNGVATFHRDANKKVTGITIEIDTMILEGTRSGDSLVLTPGQKEGLLRKVE